MSANPRRPAPASARAWARAAPKGSISEAAHEPG
uniref:Uncharacterized protein n=1 Tax=Arundo donax TaxID=35708 RepID=A0A0A9EG91_ARUDO